MGALLIICETATLLGSRGRTCIPEFSTFNSNSKCYEPIQTDYALVELHLNHGPSYLRYHPSHHFKTFLMSYLCNATLNGEGEEGPSHTAPQNQDN